MKIILSITIIILILLGGFLFLNSYIYDEKQAESLPQEQREELASDYIEQNISDLSPTPEVLGGTFYVTNIEFNDTNSGTVEYEDGHIALVADFQYSINEANNVEVSLTNVRENQP